MAHDVAAAGLDRRSAQPFDWSASAPRDAYYAAIMISSTLKSRTCQRNLFAVVDPYATVDECECR